VLLIDLDEEVLGAGHPAAERPIPDDVERLAAGGHGEDARRLAADGTLEGDVAAIGGPGRQPVLRIQAGPGSGAGELAGEHEHRD
jgi:hypothetical protein